MSMVFACVFVYVCLNNGHRIVVYEADSRIFNVILVPLRTLSTQHPRVQPPTQSMVMEKDEKHVIKMVWKTYLNT